MSICPSPNKKYMYSLEETERVEEAGGQKGIWVCALRYPFFGKL